MTARDITERKRAAQEIAALNESLRHRSEQLETVNRELEAFSYSVSHDLRAPLRHIHGFGDLLTRHAATVLDEKGKRYLATITSSATSMGRLIDDLLVFSRMGRSQLQKTAVPLGPLVADVRVGLEMETKDRRIDFRIGELPTIEGDPTMLRVVFMNLLQNAIKYTGTREAARIEVEATETNGEHVISVRDNGVGFDMEYVHKLFGVFQRLHSDEEFEGTGIGLANVRRVVQRHGGRTWAEGKLDAGATFYVTFPAMRTERTAEVVNAGAEANPAG
jgi:light-regulated signal transduction histidine kinase (bacteriophytochrome)